MTTTQHDPSAEVIKTIAALPPELTSAGLDPVRFKMDLAESRAKLAAFGAYRKEFKSQNGLTKWLQDGQVKEQLIDAFAANSKLADLALQLQGIIFAYAKQIHQHSATLEAQNVGLAEQQSELAEQGRDIKDLVGQVGSRFVSLNARMSAQEQTLAQLQSESVQFRNDVATALSELRHLLADRMDGQDHLLEQLDEAAQRGAGQLDSHERLINSLSADTSASHAALSESVCRLSKLVEEQQIELGSQQQQRVQDETAMQAQLAKIAAERQGLLEEVAMLRTGATRQHLMTLGAVALAVIALVSTFLK